MAKNNGNVDSDIAKSAPWPGFQCGIGIGGWLTNYKRFNVIPEDQRLNLTEGDFEHFESYITEADVKRIRGWGFDHVRIGFDQIVLEDTPYKFRERTFKCLDAFVEWCSIHGLNVVLNLHKAVGNYCDIQEKKELLDDEELQNRVIALWLEIERRYHSRPGIAFELLNEVRNVDPAKWNDCADRIIKSLRERNQVRQIVVGSICWNDSYQMYKSLKVWDDPNVIYTFHMYSPFEFTHQRGVLQSGPHYYNRVLEYPSDDVARYRGFHELFGNMNSYEGVDRIDAKILANAMWGAAQFTAEHPDKICWLGEFGTIRHAPKASRVAYMRDVIAFAKAHGIPWCVWNYLSTPYDGNRFSLVDDETREFLSQDLLNACLGRGDIVDALAEHFGLPAGKLAGYPDAGALEVYGDNGLCVKRGDVAGYYDPDTKELFGLQSILRENENIDATKARFDKTVAEFESILGIKAEFGICPAYSSGLFKVDFAKFANSCGEAYVYCHYFKDEGRGQIQFGAHRLPAKTAPVDPDPFGKAYRDEWTGEVNAEIDARIEKYRKADGEFQLPGPLSANVNVKVEQIDSEFKFGCNIFNFNQFGDESQNAEYRKLFSDDGIFNAATIAFYWKNIEPVKGKPRYWNGPEEAEDYWKTHGAEDIAWRRPAIEGVLKFCEANKVSVHGHVMVYPFWTPKWAYDEAGIGTEKEDPETLQALYDAHIAELGRLYGSRISQWDVVNESVDRSCTPDDVHDKLPWCGMPQPSDYTFRSFKTAEKSFPHDVKLCINDAYTGPSDNGRYPALTRMLLSRGAKIDVIGHQMHIFQDADAVKVASGATVFPNCLSWKIADQIAMLKQYDAMGKPVHISEVTIPAPVSLMPVEEAEALQARLLRDNYRLWFSWPSVYRITYWNAVDSVGGEILKSGFLRRDMSKKPVYDTLWNLVHNEWRTRTEVVSDEKSVVRFRGFKGRYRLSWTDANGVGNEQIVDLRDRHETFITPAAPQPGPDSVAEFKRVLSFDKKKRE